MDPDAGAPVPDGPTPDNVLLPGIAASALMARYGQAVDRDSAREMLARKLEAAAAQQESQAQEAAAQAKAAAEERAQAEAAERSTRSQPAPRTRSRGAEKTVVEQITGNAAFRQFARTAGREIVRGVFGAARRR